MAGKKTASKADNSSTSKQVDASRMASTEPVTIPATASPTNADDGGQQSEQGDSDGANNDQEAYKQQLRDNIAKQVKRDLEARYKEKYSDYNDLKAKAKQLDEIKATELDETERLKQELEQANQAAEQAAQQAQSQAMTNALLVALTAFRTDAGLSIRTDAIEAAIKLADISLLDYEDGQVNGVDEVVTKLIEEHAFLLEAPQKQPAASPTNPAKTNKVGTTEEQLRATYFGGGVNTGFFVPKDGNVVLPE